MHEVQTSSCAEKKESVIQHVTIFNNLDRRSCALTPPDHAVYKFMNAFDHAWNYNRLPLVLKNTFEKHPEVWNDAEHRHMATGILLSMGTNMILDREDGDVNYEVERSLAQAILVIDYYEGDGSFKPAYNAAMMKGHLALPKPFGERDILKFYCKRLSCSCLKEKYKQARKTLPKMGRCYHCHKCFEPAASDSNISPCY